MPPMHRIGDDQRRQIAWHVQEVLRRGHVLNVYVMSSWDAGDDARVYIGIADETGMESISGMDPQEVRSALAGPLPPADYTIGSIPNRVTRCMWCGEPFPSEDLAIAHEDECGHVA